MKRITNKISSHKVLGTEQVSATINVDAENTLAFIARYRKKPPYGWMRTTVPVDVCLKLRLWTNAARRFAH
jgi:hypothetical protein